MNFTSGDKICFDNTENRLYLPENVFEKYEQIGIKSLFEWQSDCIRLDGVLDGQKNLVYSAPTSAGKTLVSEIILLKRVLESKRKALYILPFVSVSREKMTYFQNLFGGIGLKVDGFLGNMHSKRGLATVDIAVCTIEKANSLVNRLIDNESLDELSLIVIDELHLLGDEHRGYLLELLLTKILYHSKLMRENKTDFKCIQIVGMSATLPNLGSIADWLEASLYICDFRPIPLLEMVKCQSDIYDCQDLSKPMKSFQPPLGVKPKDDAAQIIGLCLETVLNGHGCLIFCPNKDWCETLSTNIASEIVRLCKIADKENLENGFKLRQIALAPELAECLDNLKKCASGLDNVLKEIIPFGVAFHHAGLTNEERDIIEVYFREGFIKVIVATSTLSSGVNLPARRVIVRTPLFCGKLINPTTYKQMIGRAGRKGIDTKGESVLVCTPQEFKQVKSLIESGIPPIKSCLALNDSMSLKRALLEIIVPRVVRSVKECVLYLKSTFLQHTINIEAHKNQSANETFNNSIEMIIECLKYLQRNKLITIKSDEINTSLKKRGRPKKNLENSFSDIENDNRLLVPTDLGQAIISASFGLEDGLIVFQELDKARRSLALDTDLHLIYLLTPVYLDLGNRIDWSHYLDLVREFKEEETRVSKLIGINDRFIQRCQYGKLEYASVEYKTHKRFYSALILSDLVHECPFQKVLEKFNVSKGNLQALQMQASTYAGMVTVFCNRLGWSHLEILVKNFQQRMIFGISSELVDLVRLSIINGSRARVLFKAGFETISALAGAKVKEICNILRKTQPFQSEKVSDNMTEVINDNAYQNDQILGANGKSLSIYDAAIEIVKEAQIILKNDLELLGIFWNPPGTFNPENEITLNDLNIINDDESNLISQRNSPTDPVINQNNTIVSNGITTSQTKKDTSKMEKVNQNQTVKSHLTSADNSPQVSNLSISNNLLTHKMTLRSTQKPNDSNTASKQVCQANIKTKKFVQEHITLKEDKKDDIITQSDISKNDKEINLISSKDLSMKSPSPCESIPILSSLVKADLHCNAVQGFHSDLKSSPEISKHYKESQKSVENIKLNEQNSINCNQIADQKYIHKDNLNDKSMSDFSDFDFDESISFSNEHSVEKSLHSNKSDISKNTSLKNEVKSISFSNEHNIEKSLHSNKSEISKNTSLMNEVKCPNSTNIIDDDSFEMCVHEIMESVENSFLSSVVIKDPITPSTKSDILLRSSTETVEKNQPNTSPNLLKRSPIESSTPIKNKFSKKLRFEESFSEKISSYDSNSESILVPETQPVFKTPQVTTLMKLRSSNTKSSVSKNKKENQYTPKSLFSSVSFTTDSNSYKSSNRSSDLFNSSTNTERSYMSEDLFGDVEDEEQLNKSDSLFSSIGTDVTSNNESEFMLSESEDDNVQKKNNCIIKPGLSTVNEVSFLQSGSEECIIDVCNTKKSWNSFVKEFENGSHDATKDFSKKKCVSISLSWKFNESNEFVVTGVAVAIESTSLIYFIKLCDLTNTRIVSLKRRFEFILQLLLSPNFLLISFDWNFFLSLLGKLLKLDINQQCINNMVDLLLFDWILDSENCCHTFLDLCNKYYIGLKHNFKIPVCSTVIELIKNGKHDLTTADAIVSDKDAATQAVCFLELFANIRKELFDRSKDHAAVFKHFQSVEMPINRLMHNIGGFTSDLSSMEAEIERVASTTELLKEMAFACVGRSFNIDSPKEVSKVLFIEMRLPVNGVLNGGIVTRKNATSKLTSSTKKNLFHLLPIHPLPGIIVEYRRLLMLIEKTLNPLLESCRKISSLTSNKRVQIRCTYQQMSSTGRLTTTNPNLQSVPKPITINWHKILHLHKNNLLKKKAKEMKIDRNEEFIVTNFRSCFSASIDQMLVSADYRQLELRILTHFTSDPTLIDFFINRSEVDIFIKMASKWLMKPTDNVTDIDRQQAKQISYGIIYGISAQGLSEQMSIDEASAERMINDFMNAFPEVNKFIKTTIDNCRAKGFIETIAGRRRYIPDINSENNYCKTHAERQAVHSTVQGSAADIVKTAMVEINRAIIEDFQDPLIRQKLHNQCPVMVLHLHDELIYEVPAVYVKKMAVILKQSMEGAFRLKVPLPVKVKSGHRWSDLTDLDV